MREFRRKTHKRIFNGKRDGRTLTITAAIFALSLLGAALLAGNVFAG